MELDLYLRGERGDTLQPASLLAKFPPIIRALPALSAHKQNKLDKNDKLGASVGKPICDKPLLESARLLSPMRSVYLSFLLASPIHLYNRH